VIFLIGEPAAGNTEIVLAVHSNPTKHDYHFKITKNKLGIGV
jgi:hypothetical protein